MLLGFPCPESVSTKNSLLHTNFLYKPEAKFAGKTVYWTYRVNQTQQDASFKMKTKMAC
jgi:hypothetical protein